jgi:hypothetical protein
MQLAVHNARGQDEHAVTALTNEIDQVAARGRPLHSRQEEYVNVPAVADPHGTETPTRGTVWAA